MRSKPGRFAWERWGRILAAVACVLAMSSGAWAGQNKKKQTKSTEQAKQQPSLPPLPAAEQIDHNIGEMLAGFQVGDVELMHKYYADNATFVRSTYDPPLSGWQNYAALYNQQRSQFQGIQLIRRNTFIFPHGDVAWACYQWEFTAQFNGGPYEARGQTTLVFNKIGDQWLIVHNHTSQVYPQAARTGQTNDQSGPPAQALPPNTSRP